MPLPSGAKLGPYEILSPIGAGGMGEVYRARDSRLGRDVALKVLPQSFALEPDRLHRFEQEARAVAALNHPNILAVFDIGQENGSPFLVSELLEGETLRAALDRGALPQRKAIEYGVQIAHGLAAAHEKAIVHRDLKPENIFITKSGRVKILDFGLAKTAKAQGERPEGVTLTIAHTAAGVIMGTVGYMAPEQVRGEPVDPRADIFAFGAVLYEMLAGLRAFRRDTAVETMTAVLKDDPPALSSVSPAIDRIVRRCLEKNPQERFQSASDLSFALGASSGTEGSGMAQVITQPRRLPRLQWVYVALGLIAVAAATWWIARRPRPAAATMQFAIAVPGEVSQLALSRDGSKMVFVSPQENSALPILYVQRIGSAEATPLIGTQGASYPFWSPDGTFVAFFANGKLQKISIAGGAPQVLTSVLAGRGGTWGSQNVILYAPSAASGIWRVNADGSGAGPVIGGATAGKQTQRWPVFLPDGNHFLFWAGNFSNSKDDRTSGIYLSALDDKRQKLVLLAHSSFSYDARHLFYANDQRQLASIAFDPAAGAVSGAATAVANVVGLQPSTYWANLAAAANGTLVYNTTTGAPLSVLTWMDRSGKELSRLGEPGIVANPTLSPDGNRVAVDISDQKANNVDIWLENTNGTGNARFSFNPEEDASGIWSRDGSMVAYRSSTTPITLLLKRSTGLEGDKMVFKEPATQQDIDMIPNSWSADGQQILCTAQNPSEWHLELVSVASGTSTHFLATKSDQTNGQISPDGKWAAYASDESGNWEIYVTSFPAAAGKWQVSRGGGSEPRWTGDGKEIFYIGTGGMLMAVPVSGEGAFVSRAPEPLFQIRGRAPISSTDIFTYDVTKDGKRFLVNRYVKPEHTEPLVILLGL